MDYTVDYSIPQEEEEQVDTVLSSCSVYLQLSFRSMKITILPSSSQGLVVVLIIMDNLTELGTGSRMIWQSVMTVTMIKRKRMIPWRSKPSLIIILCIIV